MPALKLDLDPVKLLYDSGLCVIPAYHKDKKPFGKWKSYQTTRPSWEQTAELFINSYHEQGAIPNIAIVCGKVSGNFFCMDFDDQLVSVYSIVRFPELKLNETRKVKTGSGRGAHFYYTDPQGTDLKSKPYQSKRLPVEFRAEGNIIIAPPSIHPDTGKAYEFIDLRGIATQDSKTIKQVADIISEEWKYVREVISEWKEGRRDQLTMGFSCFLRKKLDLDIDRVTAIISSICEVMNDEEKYNRISQVRHEFTIEEEKTAMSGLGDDLIGRLNNMLPRGPGRPHGSKKKEDPYEFPHVMADEIMSKHHFKTASDTEELYIYNDGIYHDDGEVRVKTMVIGIDPEKTSHYAQEVIFHLKGKTYTPREVFNSQSNLIPVENGILDITTFTVQPSTPDFLFTMRIPVVYDLKADCPKFKKFLQEILNQDDIEIIQEVFGYCLLRDYRYQKAFMFIGDGANGKSTLIEALRRFLGKENVSCIPLQELTDDRFSSSMLFGRLANMFADLPAKALYQTGKFKTLTGGDTINAQKKFQDGFSFLNYAKLIFSCNKFPAVKGDGSTAYYRRWTPIVFPHAFPDNDPNTDKNLIEKITTPDELSGILNWALDGLKRLRTDNQFSHAKSAEEIQEMVDKMSEPLLAFWKDSAINTTNESDAISKEEFYSCFVQYCDKKKLPKSSKTQVGHDLPTVMPGVRAKENVTINGTRQRAWVFIRWLTDAEKEGGGSTPIPPADNRTKRTIDEFGPHDEEDDLGGGKTYFG